MKRTLIGWIIFAFFIVAMVFCGISFAFFAIGKGDNTWFAIASAFALLISIFMGLVKIPEWFGDKIKPASNKG